jgi:nitroreductase
MQNLRLALREQGVATAVTTLLCAQEPQVRQLLGLPDGFITAAHVAIGYPARDFPTRLARSPVEEIVFTERWGRPAFESSLPVLLRRPVTGRTAASHAAG